jgi:hypothetical protein
MFLRARVLSSHVEKYQYYKSAYQKIEVLTTSISGFDRWCNRNNVIMISSNKLSSARYDKKLNYIRFYLKSGDQAIHKIVDRWGYFDPDYDTLTLFGRIKFNFFNILGKFETF